MSAEAMCKGMLITDNSQLTIDNSQLTTLLNLLDFKHSLSSDRPPEGISVMLKSLWFDAKGDWEKSHDIISDMENKEAALIHAYLHRKEGDIWNADYWYRKAGEKRPDITLEKEWENLVARFIA